MTIENFIFNNDKLRAGTSVAYSGIQEQMHKMQVWVQIQNNNIIIIFNKVLIIIIIFNISFCMRDEKRSLSQKLMNQAEKKCKGD